MKIRSGNMRLVKSCFIMTDLTHQLFSHKSETSPYGKMSQSCSYRRCVLWAIALILSILFTAMTLFQEPKSILDTFSYFQNPFASSTENFSISSSFTVSSDISSNQSIFWNTTTDIDDHNFTSISSVTPKNFLNETPLILSWTKWFGDTYDAFDILFQRCPPDLQCRITHDRNLLEQSAAVVFHVRSMSWRDIPSTRRPDQYFVFGLWESPHHTYLDLSSRGHRNYFNLTLTYRRDSDLAWPYGDFLKAPIAEPGKSTVKLKDLEKIVERKSRMVAWFVSNCQTPSLRELFVQRLQTHVPVDIYGSCGRLKCSRELKNPETGLQDASSCHRILTKEYKFYLSLENSLCKDYVTEKFYQVMDDSIVIPIVLERKIILGMIKDNETAMALSNSIIAADDFSNVEALVQYLKYLDKNTTAYMQYFEWRQQYQIVYERLVPEPGCELCRVIKEKNERKIDDVGKWWNVDANCHKYA